MKRVAGWAGAVVALVAAATAVLDLMDRLDRSEMQTAVVAGYCGEQTTWLAGKLADEMRAREACEEKQRCRP